MKGPSRTYALALLGVPLVACARAESSRAATPTARPADTATPRAPAQPLSAPAGAQPAGSTGAPAAPSGLAAAHPTTRGVRVTRVAAAQGEDGAGHLVRAARPVAIDVTADAWFGRALDPVLSVGALRFYRYEHPSIDTLRFVAADADALPAGAEVAVQYGDDATSRAVVAPSLEVPR